MSKLEFNYRVRDKHGKVMNGTIDSETRQTVIDSLLEHNYYILGLEEKKRSKNIDIGIFKRVSSRDLVVMTRQLMTMIGAGLPILRSFTILQEQSKNKTLKQALTEIRSDIENGQTLAEAMSKHPKIFTPVYISMVRAGEIGGLLEVVLQRLVEHLDREREVNAKVISASVYPAIIFVFAVIVVIFILVFVMPIFTGMFESTGEALPAPTRLLMAISGYLQTSIVFIIIAIAMLTYILKRLGNTEQGRYFFDKFYLKIPIIGKLNCQIVEARFARTMGTLISTGIPVLQVMEVVEGVVGNTYISKAINQARTNITEGQSITMPLEASGVFEPMVTQMIAVGEETGALDEMLIKMSEYFDKEVMHTIEQSMAAVEPLLILLVALLIGSVVIAVLLPIFQLTGTVM